MPATICVAVVVPLKTNVTFPHTNQFPAVRDSLVQLAAELLVKETAVFRLVGFSPMLPAAGLSFVVVPLMPIVEVGEIRPVALIVVAATGSVSCYHSRALEAKPSLSRATGSH